MHTRFLEPAFMHGVVGGVVPPQRDPATGSTTSDIVDEVVLETKPTGRQVGSVNFPLPEVPLVIPTHIITVIGILQSVRLYQVIVGGTVDREESGIYVIVGIVLSTTRSVILVMRHVR